MSNHSEISIESMRKFFQSAGCQSLAFRRQSLDRLEQMIRENQEDICKALFADLSKPYHEALISEIAVTLKEIAMVKKNLCAWMKPKRQRTPLALWPAKSRIYFEPLGVVLIIAPWNYPFQLALAPLIGALAAGNCAVLKPSEITTNTSHLIANLIARYFPSEQVKVVEGGVDETTELLKIKFDHIFFTGSASVAKIIMQAAAVHLTPITLELGEKVQ